MKKVIITLSNSDSKYDLTFNLLDHTVSHRWLKHLQLFIDAGQPWDDKHRFYNFPNTQYTHDFVISHLKKLIDTINDWQPGTIDKQLGAVLTQDDLNYLHHIFEVYHGLYDQQSTNEFFSNAPLVVQDALGDLNIWVHRYESLNSIPRFVATWKYKPYRDTFEDEEYKLFSFEEDWGDLRLNYCEIGKTLVDFWRDNDQDISPIAFCPQRHMCFDFTVKFSNRSPDYFYETQQSVWEYFDTKKEFFTALGFEKYDPKLSVGAITLGKIVIDKNREHMIDMISKHQTLNSIRIE